jgi:glycosyltransferase involved in cell wall biosynthesis
MLRQIYRISAVHVYLTYPFVLSWSLLEAMSCGCLVVGSDTAPVREAIDHGHDGLLVSFDDPGALAATLNRALQDQDSMKSLRNRARQRILANYQIEDCQKRWLTLLDGVL